MDEKSKMTEQDVSADIVGVLPGAVALTTGGTEGTVLQQQLQQELHNTTNVSQNVGGGYINIPHLHAGKGATIHLSFPQQNQTTSSNNEGSGAKDNVAQTTIDKLTATFRQLPDFKPRIKSSWKGQSYPEMFQVPLHAFLRGIQQPNQKAVCLNDFHDNSTRHVLIVAPPGSGKSTILRRYGRQVALGEVEALRDIKVILLINLCHLESTEVKVIKNLEKFTSLQAIKQIYFLFWFTR